MKNTLFLFFLFCTVSLQAQDEKQLVAGAVTLACAMAITAHSFKIKNYV